MWRQCYAVNRQKGTHLRVAAAARLWSTLDILDDLAARNGDGGPAPTPSMTVAVSTRGRPALLRRSLAAILAMIERRPGARPTAGGASPTRRVPYAT